MKYHPLYPVPSSIGGHAVRNKNTLTNHLHEFYIPEWTFLCCPLHGKLFISGCLHVALNCKGINTIFIYLVLFFNNVQKENVWPMTHVYMYLKPKHKSPWLIKSRKKMIKFLWSFLFIDFKDWGLKKIQNLLLILFVKTHVSASTQIYTLKILKGLILIFCKGTEAIHWRSWIMVLCWCLIDLIMKISSRMVI